MLMASAFPPDIGGMLDAPPLGSRP
jgi:hypothetical protein